MGRQSITLTREALYRQVWAEPIVHLSERLGLSGRGLGKLCARFRIPVPARGWWARKSHGYAVRQTPLPKTKDPRLAQIVFDSRTPRVAPPEVPELAREKIADWQIEVPSDLQIFNRLVKEAERALVRSSRDALRQRSGHWHNRYQSQLVKPGAGHLDIAVSADLVPRALRVMQALLSGFEARGYGVSLEPDGRTVVSVLDEPFQIALVERFRQIHKSPGALEPSGRLYLRIGPTYSNSGISDDPPKLIDTSLNRFVTKLVRYAMAAKEQRAAAEERQRRWRIHDDALRRKQQEAQTERLRLRYLRNMAAQWAERKRVRQFVAVVETRIASGKLDAQIEEAAKARLAWAKAYLSDKDPVAAFITERWPEAPLRAPMQAPWSWE